MAAKVLIVKVTRKHIEKGKRANGRSCPIALAMRDAGFPYWVYTLHASPMGCYSSEKDFIMSAKATDFIVAFDNQRPVKPATFRLRRRN